LYFWTCLLRLIKLTILYFSLKDTFGLSGEVLEWFWSYPNQLSQRVSVPGILFDLQFWLSRVPQGSDLAPLGFTMYNRSLEIIARRYGFIYQLLICWWRQLYIVAYYSLKKIHCLKAFFPWEVHGTVIHAFVTSRINYCNSQLYGITNYKIYRLQRIQNSTSPIVTNTRKYDRITPIL